MFFSIVLQNIKKIKYTNNNIYMKKNYIYYKLIENKIKTNINISYKKLKNKNKNNKNI